VEEVFTELEGRALADMRASGIAPSEVTVRRRLDVRYQGQMNEVSIPADRAVLGSSLDPSAGVRALFEETYEARFGRGVAHAQAPLEVMTFRVEALKPSPRSRPTAEEERRREPPSARGCRDVYVRGAGEVQTAVYRFADLLPGHAIEGPAIVERPDTTIYAPRGHSVRVDGFGNIRLRREASGAGG
jgi:N-methylhydantoinase A